MCHHRRYHAKVCPHEYAKRQFYHVSQQEEPVAKSWRRRNAVAIIFLPIYERVTEHCHTHNTPHECVEVPEFHSMPFVVDNVCRETETIKFAPAMPNCLLQST